MINCKKRNTHSFDNSNLECSPSQKQITAFTTFIQSLSDFHCPEFTKLLKYLRSPIEINKDVVLVENAKDLEIAIEELIKDQYVIVQDYNEYRNSYKGVMSCIVMGNSNHSFLIDCLALRDHMQQLSKILEESKIVKLIYNPALTLQNIKKQFSLFPFNHFNLSLLQKYHPELEQQHNQSQAVKNKEPSLKKTFYNFSNYLKENQKEFMKRPLSDNRYLINLIRNNYRSLTVYAKKLGAFPKNLPADTASEVHNQEMLKQYLGGYNGQGTEGLWQKFQELLIEPYTFQKHQNALLSSFLQKKLLEPEISYHQDQMDQKTIQSLSRRDQKLLLSLQDYRNHIAKIIDINPYCLFPNHIIHKIVKLSSERLEQQNKLESTDKELSRISIMQIEQIIRYYRDLPIHLIEIWQVSKHIYYLIELNEEKYEEEVKIESEIYSRLSALTNGGTRISSPYIGQRNTMNIKQLLKDIGWATQTQWLNKNEDASIKLYKQIISIQEIDYSMTDEYIDKINNDILSMKKISRYLKFATYMRSNKIDELRKFCMQIEREDKNMSKTDALELDEAFNDEEFKVVQMATKDSAKSSNSPQKNIIPLSSMTSLQENVSNRSRKSSDSSSLRPEQIDQATVNRADIKPLPKTISDIYGLAIQVKKNTTKVKRNKEKKESKQTSEFVPHWDDIENVIFAKSNRN